MASTLSHTSMSLSFLRPLALPSTSTINRFLGATRHSTSSSIVTMPTSRPTPTPTPPKKRPQAYRVSRTFSNNLPIYLLAKRGGNLKQTRIRKIEGNLDVLKTQLKEDFGLEEKNIAINHLTKHIIIKGWWKGQVERFLEEKGF